MGKNASACLSCFPVHFLIPGLLLDSCLIMSPIQGVSFPRTSPRNRLHVKSGEEIGDWEANGHYIQSRIRQKERGMNK